MKIRKNSITLQKEEMEQMLGSKICKCGTLTPLWEWAKRDPSVGCDSCKQLPSIEDIDGIRRDTTPMDWSPKNDAKVQ